jgi:hypothetical protein
LDGVVPAREEDVVATGDETEAVGGKGATVRLFAG